MLILVEYLGTSQILMGYSSQAYRHTIDYLTASRLIKGEGGLISDQIASHNQVFGQFGSLYDLI